MDLFSKLNKENISYCHWKSNEHLIPAIKGETDLDLLVSRYDRDKFLNILSEFSYKRFSPYNYLNYPSIEDYIGFDDTTGNLIHLHVHWELKIGKKFIKSIHLPWEKIIFNNVYNTEEIPVQMINPHIEILLLFIRAALKLNVKKIFKGSAFSRDELKEFLWLKDRLSKQELDRFLNVLLPENFRSIIHKLINRQSYRNFKKLQKLFIREIESKESLIMYYSRKAHAAWNYIRFKYFHIPHPYRRTLPEGGLVICFLGMDGSGKSTLIKETEKWLQKKIDIYNIYFGSGDGRGSLLRLPLKWLASLRKKKRGDVVNLKEEKAETQKKSLLFRIARILWAISLAKEKKKKIFNMRKARNNSMIILSDRYPQTQILGYNDGPLLGEWMERKKGIKKRIAQWEYSIYKLAEKYHPDLTIKLTIPIDLAVKRKNDTPLYVLNRKAEAVEKLHLSDNEIIINSSGSVEETMKEVKKKIWSIL